MKKEVTLTVRPFFVLGKNPVFKKEKSLKFVNILRGEEQKKEIMKRIERIGKKAKHEIRVSRPIIIRTKEKFKEVIVEPPEADVFLVFKMTLGLGLSLQNSLNIKHRSYCSKSQKLPTWL